MLHPTLDMLLRTLLAFRTLEARIRAQGVTEDAPVLLEQVVAASRALNVQTASWAELSSVQTTSRGDLRLERTFMRSTGTGAASSPSNRLRAGVSLIQTRTDHRQAMVIARAGYRATSDHWYANTYPNDAGARAHGMRAILQEEREEMVNATEVEALAFVDRLCIAFLTGDIQPVYIARKN